MLYAITVSPDPARIVNKAQRRSYEACTLQEQYAVIKSKMRDVMRNVGDECDEDEVIKMELYFEINSSSMMHCHGTIELPEEQVKYFQRMVFRELGRTYIDKQKPEIYLKACCYIIPVREYVDRDGKYRSWEEYCNKDQTEKWKKKYNKVSYEYDNSAFKESVRMINIFVHENI